MRIGELAQQANVSSRVLRHYEAQNLIASTRLDNGYRDYSPETVETVRWIKELIDCGFSTRQIQGLRDFIDTENADPVRFIACLEQHTAKLRSMDVLIDLLTDRRRRLAEKISFYSNSSFAPGD
jgi:MerR family copper efflux transcriptional regulator